MAFGLITFALCAFAGTASGAFLLHNTGSVDYEVVDTNRPFYTGSPLGAEVATSPLSPSFSPEIQYWAPLIKAWAIVYAIDPNLIATVIQIESCGDPLVSSPAGAQGLFQVMPFHFQAGEDMLDVQTNAQRGITYLLGSLETADGHAGLALAGYNGGHGVIKRGWAAWSSETRRYYYWGSRIYSEAVSGMATSPTLEQWMAQGGQRLCEQASQRQKEIDEQATRAAAS